MSRLHLDCFSGLAGDMFLGACIDLGLPVAALEEAVAAVGLDGVGVEARRARRGGLEGVRFRVLIDGRPAEGPDPEEGHEGREVRGHPPEQAPPAHDSGHRHHTGGARGLAEIRTLFDRSGLEPAVRERALQLLSRLGEAEARIHGIPVEEVHFHEVGAVDSIVDLVGAAIAVETMRPERITCGPVNVGGGAVETAHGRLPVPAPATAELLAGLPIYGGPGGELLTPTGAVLLAELVDEFGELAPFVPEAAGYGLGRIDLPHGPNAVRIWRGRDTVAASAGVLVVECEVDDLPGEGFGVVMERLLEEGALDVYFTPVQMKKNRPGTLITVLCRQGDLERLSGLLLAESGSLGCRWTPAARLEAQRRVEPVATRFGEVRVKSARLGGRSLASTPEFEDCRRLAREQGVTWREVYLEALRASRHD